MSKFIFHCTIVSEMLEYNRPELATLVKKVHTNTVNFFQTGFVIGLPDRLFVI